jgi:hypothetical protein
LSRQPTNGELLGARLICLGLAFFFGIAGFAIFRHVESLTGLVFVFSAASLSLGIIGLAAPKLAWGIAQIVYPG